MLCYGILYCIWNSRYSNLHVVGKFFLNSIAFSVTRETPLGGHHTLFLMSSPDCRVFIITVNLFACCQWQSSWVVFIIMTDPLAHCHSNYLPTVVIQVRLSYILPFKLQFFVSPSDCRITRLSGELTCEQTT